MTETASAPPTRIVEFFGPSGIGKTTLARAVLQAQSARWMVKEEVDDTARVGSTPFHEDLFRHKCAVVLEAGEATFRRRAIRMVIAARVLTIDLAIRQLRPQRVLLDEGLIHHFGGRIMELARDDPGRVAPVLAGRAFVQVSGDAQTILANSKRRTKETGEESLYDDVGEDARRIAQIRKSLSDRDVLAGFLLSMGCPLLRVDASEDMRALAARVSDFVDGLA